MCIADMISFQLTDTHADGASLHAALAERSQVSPDVLSSSPRISVGGSDEATGKREERKYN